MFVNLTPHIINLPDFSVAPSGELARVTEVTTPVTVIDGVGIVMKVFGKVTGLPEPEEGKVFIVSAMVRMASPLRYDIVSPGDVIRDQDGKIVGCCNLVANF